MTYWLPILLQLMALGVGIAEALIPSFGILLVISLALLGFSWYQIIANLPPLAIWIFAIVDLLVIPVAVKVAFDLVGRSGFAHKMNLGTGSGLEEKHARLKALEGKQGEVETPLRPWGKILVDGDLYEAKSATGEMLRKGDAVRVTFVSGDRIEVEKA